MPHGPLLISSCLLALSPVAHGQYSYSVMEIPTNTPLGSFHPVDLNDSGLIAGTIIMPGTRSAALWDASNGVRVLSLPADGRLSVAAAINNAGQVAGWVHYYNYHMHASRWEADGSVRDLGVLAGAMSNGKGINERGDVVGESYTAQNMNWPSAFLYTDGGGMINLGDGGRSAWGSDVNNHGVVVGTRRPAPNYPYPDSRGFVWEGGIMADVPLNQSLHTTAQAINDRGQVTGHAQYQPYLWDPVIGMILLTPASSGEGLDVNEAGIVVGHWEYRPFIWDVYSGIRDLNTLIPTPITAEVVKAYAINNVGQILISASYWSPSLEPPRYYLLTPVPAPGSAVAGMTLAGMLCVRRRRGDRRIGTYA